MKNKKITKWMYKKKNERSFASKDFEKCKLKDKNVRDFRSGFNAGWNALYKIIKKFDKGEEN